MAKLLASGRVEDGERDVVSIKVVGADRAIGRVKTPGGVHTLRFATEGNRWHIDGGDPWRERPRRSEARHRLPGAGPRCSISAGVIDGTSQLPVCDACRAIKEGDMGITARLALLCSAMLVALGLAAGNAGAQEGGVEFSSEDSAGHCNPCPVHFTSVADTEMVSHVFGHEELVSECRDEFTLELDEAGSGHITDMQLGPPGTGTCTQQACDSATESEWPVTEAGELGPGLVHLHWDACYEDAGGGTERHCLTEATLEVEGGHHVVLHASQHCEIDSFVESEVTGRWRNEEMPDASEGEVDFEVMHL